MSISNLGAVWVWLGKKGWILLLHYGIIKLGQRGGNLMKIGFIGAGNMAGAIIQGLLSKGYLPGSDIMISRRDKCEQARIAKAFGVKEAESNIELVQSCDVVILAVKPFVLFEIIQEIRHHIQKKPVISIAAGKSFAALSEAFAPEDPPILRVSVNTPLLVGEGATVFCEETSFNKETLEWARQLFLALGSVKTLPERMLDAVVAVSGSGVAYVYAFIEAMGDGAVRLGLPRAVAYEMAAQTMIGAGKMVLATGSHPGVLKDAVCSPAGSTIEAIYQLEKDGFRGSVMSAMDACAEKLKKMAAK
jgi:pyrroline-5-carboxylate reductase